MFCQSLETTLNLVFNHAKESHHCSITVEHLLLALLDNSEAVEALKLCGADINRLRTNIEQYIDSNIETTDDKDHLSKPTLSFQRVLQRALFQVQATCKTEVTGANVLLAIFGEYGSHAVRFLTQEGVTRLELVNVMGNAFGSDSAFPSSMDGMYTDSMIENPMIESPMGESSIDRYAVNLNKSVLEGKIDHMIGREKEIGRVIQVLCRRKKNNPLLLGDPGVGKTAIAEGLAERIVHRKVPDVLKGSTVYSLDIALLLAGTKYRGDFEKRFKKVLSEFRKQKNVILFIDEIHSLIGAGSASGGNLDAANMLKPILTEGDIRCVGATTYTEHRNIFSKDHALNRRFLSINVDEPTAKDAQKILDGIKPYFEDYHMVKFSKSALSRIVSLSQRYLCDRKMPDKLIDILDEAAAMHVVRGKHTKKSMVSVSDIEHVVASMANLPLDQVQSDRKRVGDYKCLKHEISKQIFGQDHVLEVVSDCLQLSQAGLNTVDKPAASLLFTGPTGVGKTEVCKVLAKQMGLNMIRFDMSEYLEKHSVSKLIGSPPGYVGFEQNGQLTEAVNNNPYSLILFDEIEKSDPAIRNILLQIMDYGYLTDSNARKIDFRHCVIVMTSNVGARASEKSGIGFTAVSRDPEVNSSINVAFSPEFRNRLDHILKFNHLNRQAIELIIDKEIAVIQQSLQTRRIELELSTSAKQWLCKNGFSEQMGARPMKRLIENSIKVPIAKRILTKDLKGAVKFKVVLSAGELKLTRCSIG